MSFTDFLELKVLDHCLGDGAYTAPTNPYIALCTTAATDASFGSEVSGNGYARQSTSASDWAAAASGEKTNSNAITWGTATGSWGTVSHFGIFSALTSGDYLMHGSLNSSKTIGDGDTPSFAIGVFKITLD